MKHRYADHRTQLHSETTMTSAARPVGQYCGSRLTEDAKLHISKVLDASDVLHNLCACLWSKTMSLAMPSGLPRQDGMRDSIHLLQSCRGVMKAHGQLGHQWRTQFILDDQYEAETEAKHTSICGSSPTTDSAAEDEYYSRQENGASGHDSDDDGYQCCHSPPSLVPSSSWRQYHRSYVNALQRQWHRRNNLPYAPLPSIDSD